MTLQQRASLGNINRKIIWVIVLISLAGAGGYAYYSKIYLPARTTIRSSTTQTAVAQRGNLIVSAGGTGKLIANSEATFGFKTSGEVTDINVKVGDQVKAGQVLAQLDHTLAQMKYTEAQQALQELYSAASIANVENEIATAQDTEYYAHEWLKYLLSPEVVEAEENLAIAQQKLADAQATAKTSPSANADQAVKEAQSAVAFLNDKLSQTQTDYQNVYLPETFGVYENAGSRRHPKQVLATYIDPKTGEVLPKIDAPSADDIATARNNLAQAQETITEDQAYLEILKAGTIPEGATGAKLTTLYETQLAVDNAKSALDATELIAPIGGTVTSLDLSVGEQVDTSTVITVSQLSQPYIVDAYIDETDWRTAQVGNKVNITFDLLSGETFPGKVTMVYPALDSSSEAPLVHLLVRLDQSLSQNLPAGSESTVEVIGGEADGAVIVPANALHKTATGGYEVYVIQSGRQIKKQVKVGLQGTLNVEIKSGLEAGESVVTK